MSFAFHLANAFTIFIYLSFFARCYCLGAANAANEQCLIISSFYACPHFIKCLISFTAPNCHFALIVLAFFNSFCVTVASTSASTNLSSCCRCHCCFCFWTIRLRGRATVIEIKCFKSNIILIIHKENNGKKFCTLIPPCSSWSFFYAQVRGRAGTSCCIRVKTKTARQQPEVPRGMELLYA